MAKRKHAECEQDESATKKICTNPNLIRVKSEIPVLDILRQGSRKFWTKSKVQDDTAMAEVKGKCRVCEKAITVKQSSDQPGKCNFCEHLICPQCQVNCGHCGYSYCSFCSVRIYSTHGDAGRCLTCFQ